MHTFGPAQINRRKMSKKITGFTYVRNGFIYGYPFLQSIQSLLPLVDEMIVVVGDSEDGTREAIVDLSTEKIKIIDTIWDQDIRKSGKIFALQSNLGLDSVQSNWAFHIQADEVLHERDYENIKQKIAEADAREDVDGLLFPFLHFWGDYEHIRDSRRVHPFEIRAFKTKKFIRAYKDSQGFRIFSSPQSYEAGEAGQKLNVLLCAANFYHYSYSRHPYLMKKKDNYFQRFWHDDDWLKSLPKEDLFDFNQVDRLSKYTSSHPAVMAETIAKKNWEFVYDPSQSTMRMKDSIIHKLNEITGRRWFEFQNYKLIQ